jgi:putative ABC transport system permease protein
MFVLIKILQESVKQVFQELTQNVLRSFLSLLGVTIGIFCIISVLSAVDSLERDMESGLNKLGSNLMYIQKWPWEFGNSEYAFWEYAKRPAPSYAEFKMLKEKVGGASAVVYQLFLEGKSVKYRNHAANNADVMAISFDFDKRYEMEFAHGRYFSPAEANSGSSSIVSGHDVASQLFPEKINPVGKMVWALGRKLKIIGVLKEEGESIIDITLDDKVMLPINYFRRIADIRSKRFDPMIVVKGRDGVSMQTLKDEIRPLLRSHRKLRPIEEDDFAMNEVTLATAALNQTFSILNIVGWVIGFCSILVGGFGIANIMFVSVRERTNIIGIKKALGAKNYFILLEFLIEAIFLCFIGCLIGLGLVFLATKVLSTIVGFSFAMSFWNISIGVIISVSLGVVAGIVPAFIASRLDPVVAIRSK